MFKRGITSGLIAVYTCFAAFSIAGCERKERVIDIRTPGADVKVDRNVDTGKVEVETTRK